MQNHQNLKPKIVYDFGERIAKKIEKNFKSSYTEHNEKKTKPNEVTATKKASTETLVFLSLLNSFLRLNGRLAGT